ncbi:putative Ig domain-containing protein [Myxococcus stipitatus]|uniref:putative Ig domain-containing protein n=1 Tax=Myxococcus stipitatus TaxID=83455 RepID=UPI001F1C1D77|nr:putative Ig domain-containing protein [Myxococcus stipitatus]MCE9667137.1 putative Ig domain-containing protein [Myxococcus stipitatus]
MSPSRALAPLLVFLLLAACSSDPDPINPGPADSGIQSDSGTDPTRDSGTSTGDAGSGNDGGQTPDPGADDAGTEADGGLPNDAGSESDGGLPSDAGHDDAGSDSDAGLPSDAGHDDAGSESDAGLPSDAGTGSDAGLPSDAGSEADAGPVLGIITSTLEDAYVAEAYSVTLTATGGVAPYSWTVASGTLPQGLDLSTNGVLSGAPTAPGTATFTLRVQDATSNAATTELSLAIYSLPTVAEATVPARGVGETMSVTFQATGGKPPLAFSSSGTLPPGVSLSQQGVLSGTLTQAGDFDFTVTATDAHGKTGSRAVTATVLSAFTVTTPSLSNGTRGQPYQATLTASGGVEPLSWSIASGTLPSGLSLSSDGVLSGTPTAQGTFRFTVTARDANGRAASRPLPLWLAAEPSASPRLRVGQWNLTYFGDNERAPADALQVANARDVMLDVGANLWGMVEMVDVADFNALKAQLPGFNGFLADDANYVTGGVTPYGASSQKPGVLHDSTLTFQSAQLLRIGNLSDFSNRPPLRVDFTTEIQGVETPLVVIVVHMRAESADPTGPRLARERASAALEAYLTDNLPTQHVIILGDWNDDVDESITLDPTSGVPLATPYQNFVSAPASYTFITRELSLADEATSIGFENVVDHTLVTNEVAAHYVPDTAQVIHADDWVPDFLDTTSDHRPVVSDYALSSATSPFLRLKSPNGGTFAAGTVLPIEWHAWGVTTVRIEASTNGGTNWDVLAASVPAVQGRYAWTLPDVQSSAVRVRVIDVDTPSRLDESDTAITITQATSRVFINEVLADEPAINGTNNVAYEFVELVNTGPTAVDLSGWTLWDSTTGNARHVFPSGFKLAAGKAFVIFGGAAGIPTGLTNAAAASSGALGLGNNADSVRLRNAAAALVDEYNYTSTVDDVSANRSPDGDPNGTFTPHTNLPSGTRKSPGKRADGTDF